MLSVGTQPSPARMRVIGDITIRLGNSKEPTFTGVNSPVASAISFPLWFCAERFRGTPLTWRPCPG
jgi:hypothetical protein